MVPTSRPCECDPFVEFTYNTKQRKEKKKKQGQGRLPHKVSHLSACLRRDTCAESIASGLNLAKPQFFSRIRDGVRIVSKWMVPSRIPYLESFTNYGTWQSEKITKQNVFFFRERERESVYRGEINDISATLSDSSSCGPPSRYAKGSINNCTRAATNHMLGLEEVKLSPRVPDQAISPGGTGMSVLLPLGADFHSRP